MKLKYLIPIKGLKDCIDDTSFPLEYVTLVMWYNAALIFGTITLIVKAIL